MNNVDELYHFGVLGMRWGVRRGQKATDRLAKRIDQSMQSYDRGSSSVSAQTFRDLSRHARKQTYKANKRIKRMNDWLNREKNNSVNNILIKFNHDPEKVKAVKDYMQRSQLQTKKLSEMRSSLIDIKLDIM